MARWLQQYFRFLGGLINRPAGTTGFGWSASLGVSTLMHGAVLGSLAFCVVAYPKAAELLAVDGELQEPPPAQTVQIDPPVQQAITAPTGSTPGGREGTAGTLAAGTKAGSEPAYAPAPVPLATAGTVSPLDFESRIPGKNELAASALGSKLGKGLALGGGFGSGFGAGAGDGNGAEFFELRTAGTKFVYVLDGSGSMTEPHSEARSRLERVKIELLRSIGGLAAEMEFFVIFFNQNAIPMPAEKLQRATLENKRKYLEWCVKIKGGGSTDPREAVKQALKLEPDVIYLLTDGVFVENIAGLLRRENTRGIAVHTFCFGDASSEAQLKDIASQNHGTYTFIP